MSTHLAGQTTLTSWEQARPLIKLMSSWIFRGHADSQWDLSTTIERAGRDYRCKPVFFANREAEILEAFQRRAHQYLEHPPPHEDRLEWLSLVQHHGGPTRLLDCTYSFYVAAFFAVEFARGDSAVWAFNAPLMQSLVGVRTGIGHNTGPTEWNNAAIPVANEFLAGTSGPETLVLQVEPFRLSERLATQQGCFLLPANLALSFEENLAGIAGIDPPIGQRIERLDVPIEREGNSLDEFLVMKVVLPRDTHIDVLYDLAAMNVTAASLFPGLDGFARSLSLRMRAYDHPIYKGLAKLVEESLRTKE